MFVVMALIGHHCKALEILKFDFCKQISDAGLNFVVQGCPLLKSIVHCSHGRITEEGVQNIKRQYPHLYIA